jgi:Flp pilus assembly pilin Flp
MEPSTMNPVTRYAAVYGLLSGLISIAIILAGMHLAGNHSSSLSA